MEIERELSEAEFELEFLKSEWYKAYYDNVRSQYQFLIEAADISHDGHNTVRKQLLFALRAPLLQRLPASIDWHLVKISTPEFEDIRVIKELGWNTTFGNHATVKDAALAIQSGATDKGGVNFPKIQAIKRNIGKHPFAEKVILIAKNLTGPYSILEGNHRSVAFSLHKLESGQTDHIPDKFILGISSLMDSSPWLNS